MEGSLMNSLFSLTMTQTPVGGLVLISDASRLLALSFEEDAEASKDLNALNLQSGKDVSVLLMAATQLEEYFVQKRKTFSIPYDISHMSAGNGPYSLWPGRSLWRPGRSLRVSGSRQSGWRGDGHQSFAHYYSLSSCDWVEWPYARIQRVGWGCHKKVLTAFGGVYP